VCGCGESSHIDRPPLLQSRNGLTSDCSSIKSAVLKAKVGADEWVNAKAGALLQAAGG